MKEHELVEYIARYLCEAAWEDPDDYYEDFDRDAAASVSHFGEYEGWRDDVFPKIYAWEKFEEPAWTWIRFCKDHSIDLMTQVNKTLEENKE